MEPDQARWLTSQQGRAAVEQAESFPDPSTLAAGSLLRKEFPPELAAIALAQAGLRRRARTKFGAAAADLMFTPLGLEQATRPAVAQWRAQRLIAAGARRVIDLGCGIGSDARAYAEAGLEVLAVDADPATAEIARANLAGCGVQVRCARAEEMELDPHAVVFADPARRDGASNRSWRIEDFSPPWDFAVGLLAHPGGAVLKLGPGLPYRLLPDQALAEWVSHRGECVEVSLWSPGLVDAGIAGADLVRLAATVLVGDRAYRILADEAPIAVAAPRAYLLEPDPAVIRAAAIGALAEPIGATRLAHEIAYLSLDEPIDTPLATCFRVEESLPYKEKTLRGWVRDRGIGALEIKKRGVEIDPAVLRRRLKPTGPNSATLVLTPTVDGTRVLVVSRI